MHRMEAFEQVHNLEKGWSNPQNPDKARSIDTDKKQVYLAQDYERLNETLHNLVANGSIQNRTQLIEVLEASKINITRQSKDSISVKLPEAKKAHRLKGGIYAEQFTSVESLRTISDRAEKTAREYSSRDTQRELNTSLKRLSELTQYKAQQLNKQYPKRDSRELRKEPTIKDLVNRELNSSHSADNSRTVNVVSQTERGRSADRDTDTNAIQRGGQHQPSTREQELTHTERDIPKQNQTATSREQEPQRVEHTGEQSRHYQRQPKVDENNRSTTDREWQVLGVNREEIKGTDYERKINSTGATALRRIKREREESQRALQRIEQ